MFYFPSYLTEMFSQVLLLFLQSTRVWLAPECLGQLGTASLLWLAHCLQLATVSLPLPSRLCQLTAAKSPQYNSTRPTYCVNILPWMTRGRSGRQVSEQVNRVQSGSSSQGFPIFPLLLPLSSRQQGDRWDG